MNRFNDIRSFEGTQARAWEELTYQLRPPPKSGHIEARKTRAPDGEVEWYEIYEDGHEEGFQAKFNPNLEDALGSMRALVRTVSTRRPNVTSCGGDGSCGLTAGVHPLRQSGFRIIERLGPPDGTGPVSDMLQEPQRNLPDRVPASQELASAPGDNGAVAPSLHRRRLNP